MVGVPKIPVSVSMLLLFPRNGGPWCRSLCPGKTSRRWTWQRRNWLYLGLASRKPGGKYERFQVAWSVKGNYVYTDWKNGCFPRAGQKGGSNTGWDKTILRGENNLKPKSPHRSNMTEHSKHRQVQHCADFISEFIWEQCLHGLKLVSFKAGQVVTYFEQQARKVWFQAGYNFSWVPSLRALAG